MEERVFILDSYLKTMSYANCRQSLFEKFRRLLRKYLKNEKNAKKSCEEHVARWRRP
jgi:hypothetical protein